MPIKLLITHIACCIVIIIGIHSISDCLAENNNDATKYMMQLPQDLIFNGAPLDAFVMMQLTTDFKKISDFMLEKMNTINEYVDLIFNYDAHDNIIGYEYCPKDDNECRYYCFWKYLKTVNNMHLIQLFSWIGQNGEWSEMFLIERHGDHVRKTKTLFRGDSATPDGFGRAYFEKGTLYIEQIGTSFKIFMLCAKNLDELNIEDSHIDYKGIVIPIEISQALQPYAPDNASRILYRLQDDQVEVVSIILCEKERIVPAHSLLQICFDEVAHRYLKNKTEQLNPSMMKQFAQDFMDMYIQKNI